MTPLDVQALFAELESAPHAHDLYQALRRIEARLPEVPRIGLAGRPSLEAIRLGQDPEFDFASGNISSFRTRENAPPRIGVRFMGLFGPHGALPLHLTEYARDRARNHGDSGVIAFADLFHHRLLSLFYRAWAQAQPAVHVDRPADDRFGAWVGSLAGAASDGVAGGDAVPASAKRFQSGWLARGVKSAEGLESILRAYFSVPVRVESFVGHWMMLREQDRPRLGSRARMQARLARDAVAGTKVWDRQHKFRVHAGPLDWITYCDLLPHGKAQTALRDWVREYAGLAIAWDVRLVLAAAQSRPMRLVGNRPMEDGTRFQLGFNTWIGGRKRREAPAADWSDLTFDPEKQRQCRAS